MQKVLDENDVNDAYTVTSQLRRKYCDKVIDGNKAIVTEIEYKAYFYPNLSEVKNSISSNPMQQASKDLLAHEQLHFDVSDYCARLIQSELKKLMFVGTSPQDAKNKLRTAVTEKGFELKKECAKNQEHGMGAEQDAWDAKAKELVKTQFD